MSNDWIENITGEMPVKGEVLVDVKIAGVYDSVDDGTSANNWGWDLTGKGDITHWRLHKPKEKFLEQAYDVPLKYPETRIVLPPPPQKSVYQLAAETFSALSGKSLSENDVRIIVELVNVMEKL